MSFFCTHIIAKEQLSGAVSSSVSISVIIMLTVQALNQIALEVASFGRVNVQSSKFDRINITVTEQTD